MPPFATTVISQPHGPYGLFMASFTRIITVLLFVYGFQLVLRFSGIFTVMEGEGKEFTAYFEDDNLLRLQVSHSHSPTMDTELFRVISPLHTQPTDAACLKTVHCRAGRNPGRIGRLFNCNDRCFFIWREAPKPNCLPGLVSPIKV